MTPEELDDLAAESGPPVRCVTCRYPGAKAAVDEMLTWNREHPTRRISRKVMHSYLKRNLEYPYTESALSEHIRNHCDP